MFQFKAQHIQSKCGLGVVTFTNYVFNYLPVYLHHKWTGKQSMC
jgi:hypothetical protein